MTSLGQFPILPPLGVGIMKEDHAWQEDSKSTKTSPADTGSG